MILNWGWGPTSASSVVSSMGPVELSDQLLQQNKEVEILHLSLMMFVIGRIWLYIAIVPYTLKVKVFDLTLVNFEC